MRDPRGLCEGDADRLASINPPSPLNTLPSCAARCQMVRSIRIDQPWAVSLLKRFLIPGLGSFPTDPLLSPGHRFGLACLSFVNDGQVRPASPYECHERTNQP